MTKTEKLAELGRRIRKIEHPELTEEEVNGHLQECDDDNPFYPFA